ncbi:cortactin-binding protein 2 [Anguilla anguilla]|uniref:cortactin-binding protein 2 n=1 Tax=Anguilla anguilla TaxID=7936 RepID=UPI0015B2FE97|nr:cortactin-binding protein 2 [Anguilla anguilla]XP_035282654.1 cortactin-binding protein 2 [Anguilla anguilla]
MATEGASGEKPPPVQTLATAVHGSIEAKCEFNVDNLSKPELLTLLSIMEGELEARDLVIEALRARRKETFIQERYACFTITDPFLALQRDGQPGGGDKEGRSLGASPISVLEAVMAHCRKMQERMSAQLAAAESRQKKLEQEKEQLQSLQQEHRRLTAQLKDEREKNKHIVTMLVRECRQLAARVVEESQRFEELSARLQEEGKASGQLEEDLKAERQKGQQMEAQMEKQLSEMDVEREQLRACLGREEARCAELKTESEGLRRQLEELRTKRGAKAPSPTSTSLATATAAKATASVAVETDPVSWRAASCQTDLAGEFGAEGLKKAVPAKTAGGNYGTANLPKTGGMPRGPGYSSPGGLLQAENGPSGGESPPTFAPATPIHSLHSPGTPTSSLPTGVSPRVQAARYKFQTPPSDQDQNGTGAQSPRSRDVSPSNRELVAKQQARHTVTQVLSRFTSGPAGGAVRPGLPHSTSEGGPFPGRLGHAQIKSPTSGKIDRGNPPPVPPKKPGLSQAPSAPHPPIKVVGDGSRSPASGVGVPSKPATPMLPPKPALDLAGTGGASPVPALTASQVGAHPPPGQEPQWAACAECHPVAVAVVSSPPINPVSASSCRPCDSDRPLAAASGWTSSIAPSLPSGDPAPLADGCTPLLEAATQGNVTLLSMLLNPDPKDISHTHEDTNAALFSAAQNGHTDCIKLLLAAGASAEASDANGLTPLHTAAAHGHFRCLELLLGGIADVNRVAAGGQSALFLAGSSGDAECVRALLDAGADRSLATADGDTALHAAAAGGHVGCLELLLYHPSRQESSVLNLTNRDGWTPAYIAAANGYKKCLELLCGHSPHDLEQRDACNRTIHHVATDDCKDLLENLYSYRVLVRIQGGSEEQICMVDVLEDGPTVGAVAVHKDTRWEELSLALTGTLSSHFLLLTAGEDGGRDLGLSADSVSSVLIGNTVWNMDQEPSQSPWDLIRKCHCQHITVKLKGLQESSLDELAYDSLIPLQLLNNYVRLVEQYRTVILHGLEGSCQGYIANQISLCIKHRQEAMGVGCDIITVEMEEDLSKEQLLETFINCGFLVPANQAAAGRSVVMILEGLEKVRSLSELLGDLCDSLETRGVVYPVPLLHAQEGSCLHHFQEGGFLIGTLSKPHLQGAELLLQQHFRWVQLRWDSEPLAGLLTRHLRRKLVHKMKGQVPTPTDLLWRTMAWVCSVWQQLNSCVSRLGTPEALMGPQMFLSCPVIPGQTQAIVKWLTRLWNLVVVPRVEEAVISRVTVRKSPAQQQSPGNSNSTLSPSQQAVVKAALSILVNKAILQGCPLPRPEVDKHLAEFRGSRFPLSALGSYKGAGRRKGRDSAAWRRANTSPRKKSSPLSGWASGGSLREGSLSTTDLHLSRKSTTPQSCADGEPSRFSLVSDDETDLMLQLQTMCSSKSEPDIRKIPPSSEDFIVFPGTRSGQTTLQDNNEEPAQTRAKGRRHSSSHAPGTLSSEKRTARPKSQLPIPSSKSLQGEQSTGTNSRTSSKTRQAPPSNNNNQSQDIWILQRDLHVNNNK